VSLSRARRDSPILVSIDDAFKKGSAVKIDSLNTAAFGQTTRRRRGSSAVFVLAVATLSLAGCGYSLVGKASNIPQDVRSVYVEPLENRTPRQQVEQLLTQAIVEELVTRRSFEVVNKAEDADALLRGKVMTLTLRPVAFDPQGLATDFEISITADMRFERAVRDPAQTEPEVLWKNARYLFRQDYPVEATNSLSYLDRENEAIRETAESFAKTLVTDLLAGF
jgi:outer membrane lipopolysaccharide assembly protein LptE/RlpB